MIWKLIYIHFFLFRFDYVLLNLVTNDSECKNVENKQTK